MNKDSIIDYVGCKLLRAFGPLIRSLPQKLALSLGRFLGEVWYFFDYKHRARAYFHIKTALGRTLPPKKLRIITREFYRTFGENFMEVFFIPAINKEYLDKYISIEGIEHIQNAFKKGKGVILLGAHEGSWELSNIICANLGFSFNLLIQNQKYPRLNTLLNTYRKEKGCTIIERKNQTRQLIEALKKNQAIGMTVDQGGKTGTRVEFFKKSASMSSGAVRLALKYGAALIPAFYTRESGCRVKVFIGPEVTIKKTGDSQRDVRENLQAIVSLFEKYILRYPKEYLWTYKIWKYSDEKNILLLSDGKTGHLRQAQSVSKIIAGYCKQRNIKVRVEIVEVGFKHSFAQRALAVSSYFAGKYSCQGCLWCLRKFLPRDVAGLLMQKSPDIIISCGSSLAGLNFILSKETGAKSVVVMRPSVLSTRRFDLVIMPRHDNPPKRKNVVVTEGALNLVDQEYLEEQSNKLMQVSGLRPQAPGFYIGVLLGGDAKNFLLDKQAVLEVIRQIKSAALELNAEILITTSRRTSKEIEASVKQELQEYSRCKLMIIANEKNIPFAVGGILGLSRIVVASPESISMISEAASSDNYVVVFDAGGLAPRHRDFLNSLVVSKRIYLVKAHDVSATLCLLWSNKPQIQGLEDNLLVSQALIKKGFLQ